MSPLQVYECVKRILPVMAKDMGHILLKISENSQYRNVPESTHLGINQMTLTLESPTNNFFLPTNFEKYKILIFRADIYNSHE